VDSGLEPQLGIRGIEVHPGGKIPGLGVRGPGAPGVASLIGLNSRAIDDRLTNHINRFML